MNPHAKLTDCMVAAVRAMRVIGMEANDLAIVLGLHNKSVYRIVSGRVRMEAGGPISAAACIAEQANERPLFDATRKVRCQTCGGLVHPPCLKCRIESAAKEARSVRMKLPREISGACFG